MQNNYYIIISNNKANETFNKLIKTSFDFRKYDQICRLQADDGYMYSNYDRNRDGKRMYSIFFDLFNPDICTDSNINIYANVGSYNYNPEEFRSFIKKGISDIIKKHSQNINNMVNGYDLVNKQYNKIVEILNEYNDKIEILKNSDKTSIFEINKLMDSIKDYDYSFLKHLDSIRYKDANESIKDINRYIKNITEHVIDVYRSYGLKPSITTFLEFKDDLHDHIQKIKSVTPILKNYLKSVDDLDLTTIYELFNKKLQVKSDIENGQYICYDENGQILGIASFNYEWTDFKGDFTKTDISSYKKLTDRSYHG